MYIIITVLLLLSIFIIFNYNKIIKLKVRAKGAWSDIDVQLKKRYDLINNLVNVVKGYSDFEKEVLVNVTEKRSIAMNEKSIEKMAYSENNISNSLKSLFAVAENYPDLKANNSYLHLQKQLVEIEDNISYARRYYNAVVRDFNQIIHIFPQNAIAFIFGFNRLEYFEIKNSEERDGINVNI
jgi:LemA protein